MRHLQFLTALYLSQALGMAQTGRTCDYQAYRDASKLLQTFESGILSYVTYQPSNWDCVSIVRESISEDNETAVYKTLHVENSTVIPSSSALIVDQNCPSHLQVTISEEPGASYKNFLIYTDYETCKINSDPFYCPGCQMWVMNGANTSAADACLEKLKRYCGTEIIDVYDEESCAEQ